MITVYNWETIKVDGRLIADYSVIGSRKYYREEIKVAFWGKITALENMVKGILYDRHNKIVESVMLSSSPGEEIDWKDCEAEYGEDNRKQ